MTSCIEIVPRDDASPSSVGKVDSSMFSARRSDSVLKVNKWIGKEWTKATHNHFNDQNLRKLDANPISVGIVPVNIFSIISKSTSYRTINQK